MLRTVLILLLALAIALGVVFIVDALVDLIMEPL